MTDLLSAARQALSALEYSVARAQAQPLVRTEVAITALRSAIEEAEKAEPVAWINPEYGTEDYTSPLSPVTTYHRRDWTPLYVHPPQRKPLTDAEIETLYDALRVIPTQSMAITVARAIERAHGIGD
jgi:hypothetical protein